MVEPASLNLTSTYLRLRSDASVETLPVDETFWRRIMAGEFGTFRNEYLVTSQVFDADWPTWEMHPNGDEIVCLLSGSVKFVLEIGGEHRTIELSESGTYVIVPKGTWHTAKVTTLSRMFFIAAGEGTQHHEVPPNNTRMVLFSECGSTLAGTDNGKISTVTLGTVAGDPGIKPESHIFVGFKAQRHDISDNLPQFEERPSGY